MKANELMIGDWIQNTNHKIGKVIGFSYDIQIDSENERNDIVIRYNENLTCFSGCKLISPIPLTPEILEKNGINGGVWEDYYGHTLLVNNNRIKYFFDGHRRLDLPYNRVIYVHELQRALRCCGLNELADNFKID